MLASVTIEYNVKSLDRTFDYIVPKHIKDIIRTGHKVVVPFGKSEVEGIVMSLHNKCEDAFEYREIIKIVDVDFHLDDELLNLGKIMAYKTLSNLISCYQVMLPKALKASNKTNINKKIVDYVSLNDINVDKYILENKRNKKEIEIINKLREEVEVKKSLVSGPSLNSLIKKNIVKVTSNEIDREVEYIKENKKDVILTEEQKKVLNEILNSENKIVLFRGVTGSGKTEIYLKLIAKKIQENKKVIFLVPEISLTPQIVARFKSEFSTRVAVLHSKLTEGEKYDEYRRIMSDKVDIVIGARSAVFAPLKNIGAIIVDECGSASYKQDNNPKYNAIDIAIERSKYNNAICILGSATPLLEQYARALKGVYKLVELDQRVNNKLPLINIVDMSAEIKKRNFIFSQMLKDKIKEKLINHEQVILLLNRRGYSTFVSCSSCGYIYKCPNCDISLIYHKTNNNLRCHYCGYSIKKSSKCPQCKENALKDLGLGTEKLESLVKNIFPEAKVLRMDLDTTSRKGSYEKIIESFKNEEYNILVGTQMISKGLNFPKVTLVGIINADASLGIPDFRSAERTFELLMQTGGRSGRHDLQGEVIIQTYNPDNYVLQCSKRQDYKQFFKEEMALRKKMSYPPYFYITRIKIISPEYEKAKIKSLEISKYLLKNLSETFIILGPSTCSMFKVNNKYNFSIIIKYKKEENLMQVLKTINDNNVDKKISIDIDINPLNLI